MATLGIAPWRAAIADYLGRTRKLDEDFHGQAAGVVSRFKRDGRYRADENGLGDTFVAVTTDVARDFAAARGMADVNGVAQVESTDELRSSA